MKKTYFLIRLWLLALSVVVVGQSIVLFNLSKTNQTLESTSSERFTSMENLIDTLWSDFYLQNINIPEKIVFADKEIYLDEVIREELWQRVMRFQSERWRWPMLNYRLDKYAFVFDTLQAMSAPADLKYVAIQESFLNPRAISWAQAAGFWQFIQSTGRKFGLKIDWYIDQRYNPGYATIAAVKFFNYLLQRFDGDWALSAAAYNAGESRILQSIKLQGTDNYFGLILNKETTDYFINILTWKIVMEKADNFVRRFKPQVDFSIPTVEVKLTLLHPLKAKDMLVVFKNSYRVWRSLNPMYVRDQVPTGSHLIRVPKENLTIFNQILASKKAFYVVVDAEQNTRDLGG